MLADLTRLRQICCDPRLCYENYKGGSAKLETCMDLVRRGVEGEHKILLFSQFTSMLELIESRLNQEGIASYKLTGATSKEERNSPGGRVRVGRNAGVFDLPEGRRHGTKPDGGGHRDPLRPLVERGGPEPGHGPEPPVSARTSR